MVDDFLYHLHCFYRHSFFGLDWPCNYPTAQNRRKKHLDARSLFYAAPNSFDLFAGWNHQLSAGLEKCTRLARCVDNVRVVLCLQDDYWPLPIHQTRTASPS